MFIRLKDKDCTLINTTHVECIWKSDSKLGEKFNVPTLFIKFRSGLSGNFYYESHEETEQDLKRIKDVGTS